MESTEGIMTRSKSKVFNKDEHETSCVRNDGGKQLSQKGSRSSKSKGTRSTSSKANSTRRRILEAQIKADEEMAKLLAQEQEMKMKILEHEKQKVLNKLALAKIEEDGSSSSNSFEDEEGRTEVIPVEQISQKGKVQNWLSTVKSKNDNEFHENLASGYTNNDSNYEIRQLLSRQSIDKDLPIFYGDIKEWPNFYMQLTSTTNLLGLSDEENICRLRKCLKGNARRAVEGLLTSTSSVSEIIHILKSRFGRSDLIVRSLINEANNLPVVKQNDFSTLTLFADVVSNLVVTLENMNMRNYLTCPQLLTELLQKLPYNLQLSGGEIVSRNEKEFSLKDFKNWIWGKSEGANYAQLVISKGSHTMSVSHKERQKTSLVTTQDKKQNINKKCIFCKGNHEVYECGDFKKLSPDEKWTFVKKNGICFACIKNSHRIFACTRKRRCDINGCQKFHHPLLHNESFKKEKVQENEGSTGNPEQLLAHTRMSYGKQVLLRIAPLTLKSGNKELMVYALFDEASTVTLLDKDVASQLNLKGINKNLSLKWADKNTVNNSVSKLVSFDVCGTNGVTYSLKNVYTLKDMDLPVQTINAKHLKSNWSHLQVIDFESMYDAKPKLLIGQDNWDLITSREIIEGPKNSPALSKTKLGWIIHGNNHSFQGRVDDNIVLHIKHTGCDEIDDVHDQVNYFFSTESFGVKIPDKKMLSMEAERAEKIMQEVTCRVDGRWETGLLWKENISRIPDSKLVALQRLRSTERRMKRDEQFKEIYKKIEEYVTKGYAKRLSEEETKEETWNTWYLPYFGVVNENKPGKVRFVFDAAAKTQGISLNDLLIKGPDLYNSLVGILWKFRQYKIAFSSDIQEMFHQIQIRREDQHAQRFLWKENNDQDEPSIYAMQVMIFGTVSSPYSAQYVKNRNAMDFQDRYPEAVDAIVSKHYMDDYLESLETEEEAIQRAQEVMMIHKAGGFQLRSWVSNSPNLLSNIPYELKNVEKVVGDKDKMNPQRILGLKWNPEEDTLTFPMSFHKVDKIILTGEKTPTKRAILRVVMSLFDPLGLIGHFIIKGKIILQQLWKTGITWDDEITEEIEKKWRTWLGCLRNVENLKIPRCYNFGDKHSTLEIHTFCDSSEQAFAAASYFRFKNGNYLRVCLLMSRTQVAPIKQMSIPRLELQAAVMASRLAEKVKEEHTLRVDRTFFWTDSKTVLCWIRSEKRNFKIFVAHRVGEIHERSEVEQWKWVPTKLNVADDATRFEKETDLNCNSRWYVGPDFLYSDPEVWPKEENKFEKIDEKILELKTILAHHIQKYSYLPDIGRFSRWTYLIRSTAYVLKFIRICRKQVLGTRELTREDLKEAELLWIRKTQEESFGEDIRKLVKEREVQKNSRLLQLSPGIDQDKVLRLYGRTDKASTLLHETRRPIILDGKHPYTKLLIYHYHCYFHHKGTELVLNQIRQKFWIIQGRKAVHTVSQRCMQCRIQKARPIIPEMGQVPEFRMTRPPRPFSYVGWDYFGPYDVTIGRRKEKRYGVLFTCLSIRAIHIELAESLTTDSAILAMRRFFARRGQPCMMISDNGTNLKGASKELRKVLEETDENLIKEKFINYEIEWKFIPPGSPHMGGAWERMVRSVKQSLKITLKERAPRPEVLYTLLCEAEQMVNSRPLTYVSSDSQDEESITPNHFLIGRQSNLTGLGLGRTKKGT